MEEQITGFCPYKGLMPYTEEDEQPFFGRDKDTRLIIANLFAAPLTLLYGASGVGKTSVLRAGVIKQLRQRDDLLVIFFNAWQIDPLDSLKDVVIDAVSSVTGVTLQISESASLAEYLATSASRLKRRMMIILDQFEEYFLYHPRADAFAAEFPEAVTRVDIPIGFLISIREDALAKLDRFEGRIPNLFDKYRRLDHLDRRAAREAIEKPLEYYNDHYAGPGKEVVIDKSMVSTIIDQVSTGKVIIGELGRGRITAQKHAAAQIETPYLQLVMMRLWEEEMKAGSRTFRRNTLNELGEAEGIVRTHLDVAMKGLKPNEQDIAASIFNYLVTPSGTKIALTADDLFEFTGLPQIQIARLLDKLSRQATRILRPVALSQSTSWGTEDIRGRFTGARQHDLSRYEIFHDALAPAILDWRTRYLQEQERVKGGRKAMMRWIFAAIIALVAGLSFGIMSYRYNWGGARVTYLAGKNADPMDVIDWLLDEQVWGNIVLDDVNNPGTRRALVALRFAYELDPKSRKTTEFLERLVRSISIQTRPKSASLEILQNSMMILEEIYKEVPYSPLLSEANALKARVLLGQLDQQSQNAAVSDTTLLNGYQHLLKTYSYHIDTISVKKQIAILKESVARFARQLAVAGSDTVTINQKLASWKDFTRSQRASPEKSHADGQIELLESLKNDFASIESEDDFVTCRNVVDRVPQGISDRFSSGTVWAWARLKAPRTENVTFKWYAETGLFHTHQLAVNQATSYRVYTAKSYGADLAGRNEVRLYNSQNLLIGRRVFFIR
ncbi:MAG: ATP-binding protein [candidate division KSB1 bacterium]|nr:ATP-binding protein [candidate division KSB1 bacterium]MDZ7301754.1 ATP-binding protein [candidate division KSB1 bacterium]MDZ7311467.1 ATP-binding protein [candidate division KSB1 bacterium]